MYIFFYKKCADCKTKKVWAFDHPVGSIRLKGRQLGLFEPLTKRGPQVFGSGALQAWLMVCCLWVIFVCSTLLHPVSCVGGIPPLTHAATPALLRQKCGVSLFVTRSSFLDWVDVWSGTHRPLVVACHGFIMLLCATFNGPWMQRREKVMMLSTLITTCFFMLVFF